MPRRRVLSAEIAHETNTFSVLATTLESYRSRLYYEGADIAAAMGGSACEIAAHLDAAERFGWDLAQPIAARATPSGKTTAEAWAEPRTAQRPRCRRAWAVDPFAAASGTPGRTP